MNSDFCRLSGEDTARLKFIGKRAGKVLYAVFRMAFLIAVGYIVIYPMLHMIVSSMQSKYAFLNSSRVWIPSDLSIKENYKTAVLCLDYVTSLISTLKNEIVAGLIQVVSCAVAAYGFARFEFKGKKIKLALLFLTIIVPDMMLLIPRMINYSHLDFLGILALANKITDVDVRPNILGSVITFWLPSFFGVGLKSGILIYIYIQFFKGLPRELEEAAWVDGAGPIRTFCNIAVPSSSVVIITVFIFSVIWHWNEYFLSVMYFSKNNTLSVRLANIRMYLQNSGVDAQMAVTTGIIKAACLLFILPMLIMYLILQRKFIQSIDRVGIVG